MKELLECLEYCKEQNGLPYCKNCGLDMGMIKNLKAEILKSLEDYIFINSHEVEEGKFIWREDILNFIDGLK